MNLKKVELIKQCEGLLFLLLFNKSLKLTESVKSNILKYLNFLYKLKVTESEYSLVHVLNIMNNVIILVNVIETRCKI